jgi:hypothetical protein
MPTDYGNAPGQGPLRLSGVELADPLPPGDLPNAVSKAAERQQPAVVLMRDVVAGPERIRDAGGTYLPQDPGENPKNYRARLLRSVFVNFVGRTLNALVGQVFRVDPVLGDDVPALIAGTPNDIAKRREGGHWENIDLAGTHGDVFCRAIFQDAMAAGHAGILVDYPNTGGAQDHRAELLGEIRPYWVPIKKEDIVSWRTAIVGGKTVLAQLVLKECTMVPAGQFGEKEQTRYRVFQRDDKGVVSYRLLEINEDKRTITEHEAGTYPTQSEIPFSEIVTSGRQGLLESKPPLLDIAYLNLTHYQTDSDHETSIHKTCVPVYVETGVEPESEVVIGPNTVRQHSNPEARAQYVSHDGASLGEVRAKLQDREAQMGALGMAMITPQRKATNETATAHRQDKGAEDSDLAVGARGLQDGVERALGFHANYLKQATGGSITINRDFDQATMQADMLTAWSGAVANAGVPSKFMIADMQKGKLIPPEEDADAIADEMAANQAAADEAAAQREADLLAMKQPAKMPMEAA